LWLVLACTPLAFGLRFYLTPLEDRAYSPQYEAYKPSGLVGHGLGVIGSLMMIVGVSTYSLRKRVRAMAKLGRMRSWLRFHIFLCTLGPFFVLLHTSFKIGGLVSVAFWSMTIVVLSGIFGRYVFVRLPQTVTGKFLTVRRLSEAKHAIADSIADASGGGGPAADFAQLLIDTTPPEVTGFVPSMAQAVQFDLGKRRRRKLIDSHLSAFRFSADANEKIRALVEDHIRLSHQVSVLQPFQKLFGYWHVFHLPLAIVMFLIMIVHIVVAALFGYAWVF
jgi:hypothetical protein